MRVLTEKELALVSGGQTTVEPVTDWEPGEFEWLGSNGGYTGPTWTSEDEALYPMSSGEIATKVKKTTIANPLPSPEKAFTVPPKSLLSEDEIKRLERSFGLNNGPQ